MLESIYYECGGLVTYVPKKYKANQHRDKAIYAEFTGNNAFELSRKYQLSVAWIYKIIKKERNENRHI